MSFDWTKKRPAPEPPQNPTDDTFPDQDLTENNENFAARELVTQEKFTLLQSRLQHEYDFASVPPPRPMLLNYINPFELDLLKEKATSQPFLPQAKVGLFIAPGGTGKTQALSQLAVSVATGRAWLDCFHIANIPGLSASKGRVLLALGEEDENEIIRRINPYVKFCLNNLPPTAKTQFEANLRANLKPLALDGAGPRMLGTKPHYEAEPFFDALCKLLEHDQEPWRLIILDHASRFMGPDCEVDNNAATRFIELVEQLTKLPGSPTVLLAHHTRKSSSRNDDGKDAARGSSALSDGARWVAQLKRELQNQGTPKAPKWKATGRILLDLDKSNYTRLLNEPIKLKFNDDGYLERVTENNHQIIATFDTSQSFTQTQKPSDNKLKHQPPLEQRNI